MLSATRTALKLPLGATDKEGAAALDKGGHELTMRSLEKSDTSFLLYLKREQPDTYSRLYQAYYGKKPTAATKPAPAAAKPGIGQPAKAKLAALGANITLRDLEKSDPALVLELKHQAPDEYARLFAAQYGGGAGAMAGSATAPEAAPAAGGAYRPAAPIIMRAVAPESIVAERLRVEGETPCPLPLLGQSGY